MLNKCSFYASFYQFQKNLRNLDILNWSWICHHLRLRKKIPDNESSFFFIKIWKLHSRLRNHQLSCQLSTNTTKCLEVISTRSQYLANGLKLILITIRFLDRYIHSFTLPLSLVINVISITENAVFGASPKNYRTVWSLSRFFLVVVALAVVVVVGPWKLVFSSLRN